MDLPIDLSAGPTALELYGTGIRNCCQNPDTPSNVTVTIGNQTFPAFFAGPAPGWVGLDQVNVGPLPSSLAGSGTVTVTFK